MPTKRSSAVIPYNPLQPVAMRIVLIIASGPPIFPDAISRSGLFLPFKRAKNEILLSRKFPDAISKGFISSVLLLEQVRLIKNPNAIKAIKC